ncbi:MAG: hypothetical protein N4A36_02655 [Candidatus Gracilibacteria bacterium]|jgi:hypothetical protein|nr:hypothetical protein [Candidatus Gracilibacteria bacterium]
MISYLSDTKPRNNREKALKTRITKNIQNNSYMLDELIASRNTDGGIPLYNNYQSDFETTLEFILAMQAYGRYTSELIDAISYILNRINQDGTISYQNSNKPNYYLMNKTIEMLYHSRFYQIGNQYIYQKIKPTLAYLYQKIDPETGEIENGTLLDSLMFLYNMQLYENDILHRAMLYGTMSNEDMLNIDQINIDLADKLRPKRNVDTYGNIYADIYAMRTINQPDIIITNLTRHTTNLNIFYITYKNIGYRKTGIDKVNNTVDDINLFGFLGNTESMHNKYTTRLAPLSSMSNNYSLNDFKLNNVNNIKFYIDTPNEFKIDDNNWISLDIDHPTYPDMTSLYNYLIAHWYETEDGQYGINMRWDHIEDPRREDYVIMKKIGNRWQYAPLGNPNQSGAFVTDVNFSQNKATVNLGVKYNGQIYYTSGITISNVITNNISGSVGNKKPYLTVGGYGFNAITDKNGNFSSQNLSGKYVLWIDDDEYEKIMTPVISSAQENLPKNNVRVFTKLKDDSTPPIISDIEINGYTNLINNQRDYDVFVYGSDNVKVKEADLYYFEPQQNRWFYIYTQKFDGNHAGFKWYAPSSLNGQGYKLKAIIRDFRDNESEAFEYGPFEIIDGTPPSGDFGVIGLENNTWNLGETKEIRWDLSSSTNEISEIIALKLKYNNDYNTQTIETNIPLDTTHTTWQMPFNANFSSENAHLELHVYDINDNLAALESGPFQIADSSAPPQSPWNQESLIGGMIKQDIFLERYIRGYYKNDDGSKEIIYTEFAGNPSNSQYRRIIYRKLNPDGTWQEPVKIIECNYRTWSPSYDIYFTEVKTQKLPDSSISVIYSFINHSVDDTNSNKSKIRYKRIQNGSMVSSSEIFSYNKFRDIAYSINNDDIHVAFRTYGSNNTNIGSYYKKINRLNGQSISYSNISPDKNYDLSITTNHNGNPVAVYRKQNEQWYTKQMDSQGTWSNEIILTNMYIQKSKLDIYQNDATKLPLIIDTDPNNPNLYKWKESCRTLEGLTEILDTNNFENKSGIIEKWKKNNYSDTTFNIDLFKDPNTPDKYHAFSMQGHYDYAGAPCTYNIIYFPFTLDGQIANLGEKANLVDRKGIEDVRLYRILQNSTGNFHVFYIMREIREGFFNNVYHLFFDQQNTYFNAHTASTMIHIAEDTLEPYQSADKIGLCFDGYAQGGIQIFCNDADYSGLLNYKIQATSPENHSQENPLTPTFSWQAQGGQIDNFEIKIGLSKEVLNSKYQNIQTQNLTPTEDLLSNQDYYWQIVGHQGDTKIHSNIYHFKTQ